MGKEADLTKPTHPGVRVVECHVEELSYGDTCCACAARGARAARPVLASTYRRDSPNATESPGRIALCSDCAALQYRESLRDRRRRLLALTAVFAALGAVFGPRTPSFALVAASVAALQWFAWIAHERSLRGSRVPATVLSCEGEEMRVQLLDRAAQASDAPVVRGDFGAKSASEFASFALASILLAYPLWTAANPEVTFVSRLGEAVRVSVDGRQSVRILPAVSARVRLAYGEHALSFASDPALPPLAFRSTLAGETTVRLALPDCDDPETGESRPFSLRWRRHPSQGYLLECDYTR